MRFILFFAMFAFLFISCSSGSNSKVDSLLTDSDLSLTDDGSLILDTDTDTDITEVSDDTAQINDGMGKNDDIVADDDSDQSASGDKVWTRQWGTKIDDRGYSVAVDSTGNIFVAGRTQGSLDGNINAGDYDIFLTKWNADGTKAWTRQWGTTTRDYGYAVAVDSTGHIFVAGHTGGYINAGDEDIFLTKWEADGTRAWTKQWGTASSDEGSSAAVDSAGNIFVAGYTGGSLDGNINAGEDDIFLTKWMADGTKAWTKQWGTTTRDYGNAVAVDSTGNIFVAGITLGSLDDNTSAGEFDIFLTKWNADGIKAWTKQWGTAGSDYVQSQSVVVDSAGNIFVAGTIKLGSLDDNTNAGWYHIFLAKWNADGTKAWTKQWGTAAEDYGNSVAVDSAGSIFVTGKTYGSLDGNKNAGGACDESYYGSPCPDMFLTKWAADGTKAWTKQWGTSDYDEGYSIAVDSADNIFVTGHTGGSLDGNINAGASDIFLIKYRQ